jgi:hypothetical protein
MKGIMESEINCSVISLYYNFISNTIEYTYLEHKLAFRHEGDYRHLVKGQVCHAARRWFSLHLKCLPSCLAVFNPMPLNQIAVLTPG